MGAGVVGWMRQGGGGGGGRGGCGVGEGKGRGERGEKQVEDE